MDPTMMALMTAANAVSSGSSEQAAATGTKGVSLTQGVGGGMADAYGQSALVYMPGRFERQYRKTVRDEAKALQKQKGGLSAGETQRALATGQSQIAQTLEQQRSQLARMAGMTPGTSGQAQAMQRDLNKQAFQAGQKLASNVNTLSMQELRRKQAELKQNQLVAAQMEYNRRMKALKVQDPTALAMARQQGYQAQPSPTSQPTFQEAYQLLTQTQNQQG